MSEMTPSIRPTEMRYGIDVTRDQFLALEAWEERCGIWPSPIHEAFAKLPGVDVIEMNGHFGASIFVAVDAEHDNPETHAALLATTQEMLRQAGAPPSTSAPPAADIPAVFSRNP